MARPPRRFGVVLTMAGSQEQAGDLAQKLVERRLAACVNIVSQVHSVYRWKGNVSRDEERLLVIKTAVDLFPALRDAIRELHAYELPEVVMLPIQDGDPDYLAWLEDALRPEGP